MLSHQWLCSYAVLHTESRTGSVKPIESSTVWRVGKVIDPLVGAVTPCKAADQDETSPHTPLWSLEWSHRQHVGVAEYNSHPRDERTDSPTNFLNISDCRRDGIVASIVDQEFVDQGAVYEPEHAAHDERLG